MFFIFIKLLLIHKQVIGSIRGWLEFDIFSYRVLSDFDPNLWNLNPNPFILYYIHAMFLDCVRNCYPYNRGRIESREMADLRVGEGKKGIRRVRWWSEIGKYQQGHQHRGWIGCARFVTWFVILVINENCNDCSQILRKPGDQAHITSKVAGSVTPSLSKVQTCVTCYNKWLRCVRSSCQSYWAVFLLFSFLFFSKTINLIYPILRGRGRA